MAHKFRHFFFCIGAGTAYETGTIEAHLLIERDGWCDVGHEKAKGEFGPKAKIVDYVVENAASAAQEPVNVGVTASATTTQTVPGLVEPEDDVPF
jgi:hypothetical protein